METFIKCHIAAFQLGASLFVDVWFYNIYSVGIRGGGGGGGGAGADPGFLERGSYV